MIVGAGAAGPTLPYRGRVCAPIHAASCW